PLADLGAVGLAAEEMLLVPIERLEQEERARRSGGVADLLAQLDEEPLLEGDRRLERGEVVDPRPAEDRRDDLPDGAEPPREREVPLALVDALAPLRRIGIEEVEARVAADADGRDG